MSTRSTLALVQQDQTDVHLYREVLDESAYLEIARHGLYITLVVPESMVEDLTALLVKAKGVK